MSDFKIPTVVNMKGDTITWKKENNKSRNTQKIVNTQKGSERWKKPKGTIPMKMVKLKGKKRGARNEKERKKREGMKGSGKRKKERKVKKKGEKKMK